MDPITLAMIMQGANNFKGGLGQFMGGMFGNSGAPYEKYGNELERYFNRGIGYQNPFFEAGSSAVPNVQDWLSKMKDPSQFINNLTSQYKESPWATYQKDQAQKTGMNAASAGGLLGSTPFAQEMARTSAGISSGDMQNWLQNVLGVNTQYGAGQMGLMQGGQNAANSIAEMLSRLGIGRGEAAFGQQAGENQDRSNIIGGLMKMFLG